MQQKTLSHKEIYRIALARGMTAKQAGAYFGVRHNSIAGIKGRYGFPSLISEFEYADRKGFESMSDNDLRYYINALEKDKKTTGKEWTYANDEVKRRNNEKQQKPTKKTL
jgi:hypothetical protein